MQSVINHRKTLAAAFPVFVVACIAAVISYGHIETLALTHHQPLSAGRMLPFAVDFLIVAGTVIVLNGYGLGWLCIGFGVFGTLFANMAYGLPYGWESAAISAWPAVAFTVASFVLERWIRHRAREARMNVAEAEPVAEVESVLAQPVDQPEPVAELPPLPDPEPEPQPELVAEEVAEPEPTRLPQESDTEGLMAKHLVAQWAAKDELNKLWEIVDDHSERQLHEMFNLRTRHQGVRLKQLRARAAA